MRKHSVVFRILLFFQSAIIDTGAAYFEASTEIEALAYALLGGVFEYIIFSSNTRVPIGGLSTRFKPTTVLFAAQSANKEIKIARHNAGSLKS